MGFVRAVGAGIGGLATGVAVLLFVLLIVVGGNTYRKDCLTNRGTVSTSWTFTWDTPIPYVFAPSETSCVVHSGTRVAFNAVGVDTFRPSTPESIASSSASSASGNPYWPKLRATLVELINEPRSASLSAHIAELQRAREALSSLSPPAAYGSAHRRLVGTTTLLLVSGQQLQKALLHGDASAETAILRRSKSQTAGLNADIAVLNGIHSAQ